MKRSFTLATILTVVLAVVSLEASAQKGMDTCIQDDSGSPMIKLNSSTGQYNFDDCDGAILAGFGGVSRYSGRITISIQNGDFKGAVTIDSTNASATGWLRNRVTGETVYTINDASFKNNTCSCP